MVPLERSDYVAAAGLHRTCASAGVTASTVDCLIAAVCIREKMTLLTVDADFQRIARLSPLKLADTAQAIP